LLLYVLGTGLVAMMWQKGVFDDHPGWAAIVDYVYDGFKLRPVGGIIPNVNFEYCTIIGNAYEHPELLPSNSDN